MPERIGPRPLGYRTPVSPDSPISPAGPGFHLRPTDEDETAIRRLTERFGSRVGLAGVLADLNRPLQQRHARGRAVGEAYGWDDPDARSDRWWPVGVTPAPAGVPGRLLVAGWHSRSIGGEDHGSRVSVVDLEARRYRHVLLVTADESFGEPVFRPLPINAGGLAWHGDWLYVAGDRRGIYACRVADLVAVDRPSETFGYRYLLPTRVHYRAATDPGVARMQYSFLSRDDGTPGRLVAGEYDEAGSTRRLVNYRLDEAGGLARDGAGRAVPEVPESFEGPADVRGAAAVGETWYATVTQGRHRPGRLLVGRPGSFRALKRALPADPADLGYEAATDMLWTVTGERGHRYVVGIDRGATTGQE